MIVLFFYITGIFGLSKMPGYLIACGLIFAILSAIYYMKSKTDDLKLAANGNEIEITDDLIAFRKYKNGNINNEKKYAVDEIRGFREKGPYIMIKVGAMREKQVLDFEYEEEDIETLKTKLKKLSNKRMHSNAYQR